MIKKSKVLPPSLACTCLIDILGSAGTYYLYRQWSRGPKTQTAHGYDLQSSFRKVNHHGLSFMWLFFVWSLRPQTTGRRCSVKDPDDCFQVSPWDRMSFSTFNDPMLSAEKRWRCLRTWSTNWSPALILTFVRFSICYRPGSYPATRWILMKARHCRPPLYLLLVSVLTYPESQCKNERKVLDDESIRHHIKDVRTLFVFVDCSRVSWRQNGALLPWPLFHTLIYSRQSLGLFSSANSKWVSI